MSGRQWGGGSVRDARATAMCWAHRVSPQGPEMSPGRVAWTKPANTMLVVGQHFWPESFGVNDICDYLTESGCDLEVLCGIPNYPQGDFFPGYSYLGPRKEVHNGIRIRRVLEIPRRHNSNFRIITNYLSFPFFSLFHIPGLLTRRYDKIFLYQLSPVMMSFAGIFVGRVKNVETTLYVLDLWPENLFSVFKIKNAFLRRVATRVSHWHYKKVDKLVVLSERMKTRLIDITNISEDKILVLPQISDKLYEVDVFDEELSKRFGNGFNIVFAGNISPAQDFETVITVAQRLEVDGIRDINWIIVGDGMSRKWLEAEVAAKGLAGSFSFEGFKPPREIPKYHTVADALLACLVKSDLLDATIPAKVMSYFAAGRPMLLAMDGEAQRLVNSIGCGFAGGSSDADALYRNIKALYSLPKEDRELMGKKARDYHFKHFERNMNMEKLRNFIFN